ncbi:MAG TPA: helix-turn-helix domain-containing protein [Gemmatimonadales bacterium]|jgi:AcrR family transcriptional regulator|nr:helix-turn-helix domain-containing protein [Gemmatimonadales bacterium]
MDLRQKILDAATELYAETGFRGTTTRQIAQLAGVNEVTLFRHFGSKTALLHEAIRCACATSGPGVLPVTPAHPRVELLAWARLHWEELWTRRSVIRTAMGEIEEHPGLLPKESSASACAGRELAGYIERLRAQGLARAEFATPAAAMTLMGTLFADAMSRDVMPFAYRLEPKEAIEQYVDLFVRAIGAEEPA